MNWTVANYLINPNRPLWSNPWIKKVIFSLFLELVNLLEDKDKTIRKLTKKIEKLEDTIKKSTTGRAFQDKKNEDSDNDNKYLQLLKAEI